MGLQKIAASYLRPVLPELDGAELRILGEGLWGIVLDLNDGTVLKLTRKHAGVGDGVLKIRQDIAALQALSAVTIHNAKVPIYHSDGTVPLNTSLADDGFSVWSRISRLPGRVLTVKQIGLMNQESVSLIGRSIGKALAELHLALAHLPVGAIPENDRFVELNEAITDRPVYKNLVKQMRKAIDRLEYSEKPCFRHGDFNISNLLFDEQLNVSGIVDFAECRPGYLEKDISDIVKEVPQLEAAVIEEYEKSAERRISKKLIRLGLAENLLTGAIITELRENNPKAAEVMRKRFEELLGSF